MGHQFIDGKNVLFEALDELSSRLKNMPRIREN